MLFNCRPLKVESVRFYSNSVRIFLPAGTVRGVTVKNTLYQIMRKISNNVQSESTSSWLTVYFRLNPRLASLPDLDQVLHTMKMYLFSSNSCHPIPTGRPRGLGQDDGRNPAISEKKRSQVGQVGGKAAQAQVHEGKSSNERGRVQKKMDHVRDQIKTW